MVLCRSGTALPPTPNRDSKRNEVEAWLGWFGKSINLGNLRIRRLQAAFSVDGESLLSFSVTDCQQYCQQAGIQPAIGASMYRRLHSGVVRCSIAPHRYLSIYLSILSFSTSLVLCIRSIACILFLLRCCSCSFWSLTASSHCYCHHWYPLSALVCSHSCGSLLTLIHSPILQDRNVMLLVDHVIVVC